MKSLSNTEIQNRLPQSPPFIFVDKIIELEEEYAVGIKNVTCTEPFLLGHFPPDDPVFPGVLLIEACGQTGALMLGHRNQHNPRGYLAQVNNFKFINLVKPGDTIVIKAMFNSQFGQFAKVNVEARVEDKIVAKGMVSYYFKKKLEKSEVV